MYYKLAVISFIIIQLLIYLPVKFLINVIIMSLRNNEPYNGDEVFFGDLSLKELRSMFISHQNNRQTIAANENIENDDHDMSLKLISTQSEPDIRLKRDCDKLSENIPKSLSNATLSPDEPNLYANWDVTDSFLNLEKMVENSCDTSSKEFDNTLEEIEYLLKKNNKANNDCKEAELEGNQNPIKVNKEKVALNAKPPAVVTPMKQVEQEKEIFATPSSVLCATPSLCRTPDNPPLFKKPSTSSVKKTTGNNNAFQHVGLATLSPDEPNLYANWDVTDSFLNLEKMVENSCDTSSEEFDNTLEEIEYLLRKNNKANNDCKETELEGNQNPIKVNKEKVALNAKPPAVVTPMKQVEQEKEIFATPSSVLCATPSLCRTPDNPPLFKKPSTSSVKKTPGKNNAFQHVASPVAYYINNSPQIPLKQNVHPKKTLPRPSCIPKLVKTSVIKQSNKENHFLPSVAYKSAKKTTVIDVTNLPKMPQCQWVKKLTTSLPRPAVIKHTHREKGKKPLLKKPEDSFGDLSLDQADISVCTKKAAF